MVMNRAMPEQVEISSRNYSSSIANDDVEEYKPNADFTMDQPAKELTTNGNETIELSLPELHAVDTNSFCHLLDTIEVEHRIELEPGAKILCHGTLLNAPPHVMSSVLSIYA
ncbi:Uncharacterized protein Fot_29155 [Forsythia ovata]|uniref:Uncharacterized protein n=1 Tax=Forsythia ovata TaxID=205694 RepID=A0ABD1TR47_9LAMI